MSEERKTKFILLIGTNGTGKTTVLKKLVLTGLHNDSRALIITPDMAEWVNIPLVHERFPDRIRNYKGARRLVATHSNAPQVLENVRRNFSKGSLVFDDCRAFLKATTNEFMEALLIRRRQMEIDVFVAGHNFDKIPPAFFTYATDIILFKTIGKLKGTRRDNVNDAEKIIEAQQRVNARASDTAKAWLKSGKIEHNQFYKERIQL